MVFRFRTEKALNQLERMVLPPPGGANVGILCRRFGVFLTRVPAGGCQVYAPRDETRRGAAGDICPFGEDPPRKHGLLRPKSQ